MKNKNQFKTRRMFIQETIDMFDEELEKYFKLVLDNYDDLDAEEIFHAIYYLERTKVLWDLTPSQIKSADIAISNLEQKLLGDTDEN